MLKLQFLNIEISVSKELMDQWKIINNYLHNIQYINHKNHLFHKHKITLNKFKALIKIKIFHLNLKTNKMKLQIRNQIWPKIKIK